ncbi:MAG: DNA mismatch repair protein MutS, partial [Clostridiales bacterium]|nr:DNA mismatch repair protein MutS [Clostridiales bacterium]
MRYVSETRKASLDHIVEINYYIPEKFLVLDPTARKNLEITYNLTDGKKYGTLLWVLDKSVTSMGARTLRRWLEQPLMDINDITMRLDAVGELKDEFMMRMDLFELLKNVYDMERLTSKLIMGSVNGRDLIALKTSIDQLPHIVKILEPAETTALCLLRDEISSMQEVSSLIGQAIVDSPPLSIKEGRVIRDGYNSEIDELRKDAGGGKEWLMKFEAEE